MTPSGWAAAGPPRHGPGGEAVVRGSRRRDDAAAACRNGPWCSHRCGRWCCSPPPRRSAARDWARPRVASELVVVDSALRPGVGPEQWQERILNDGSRHRVCKRYFTGEHLAQELDGEKLFEGTWFAASRTSW